MWGQGREGRAKGSERRTSGNGMAELGQKGRARKEIP